MTLYLVKHASDDWRLHREDGTELDTYTADPRPASEETAKSPASTFVESVATHHPTGERGMGDPGARSDYADIIGGNWVFRDVAAHGMSEVPW